MCSRNALNVFLQGYNNILKTFQKGVERYRHTDAYTVCLLHRRALYRRLFHERRCAGLFLLS